MYVYTLGGKCLNLELSCDKKPWLCNNKLCKLHIYSKCLGFFAAAGAQSTVMPSTTPGNTENLPSKKQL